MVRTLFQPSAYLEPEEVHALIDAVPKASQDTARAFIQAHAGHKTSLVVQKERDA